MQRLLTILFCLIACTAAQADSHTSGTAVFDNNSPLNWSVTYQANQSVVDCGLTNCKSQLIVGEKIALPLKKQASTTPLNIQFISQDYKKASTSGHILNCSYEIVYIVKTPGDFVVQANPQLTAPSGSFLQTNTEKCTESSDI